ncbi:MAG: hypothetical protein NT007_15520 [Candidatus Kapabacteria bacterium]|nr:hypothetical protein [Candidatus Kapabacteria bacterium]
MDQKELKNKSSFRLWIHVSSMGEFEQIKPVIEQIKTEKPEICILVSFFSPSGFETQKNYKNADYKLYLPIDSKRNIRYFLDKVQPDFAIFVRYELWLNTLSELNIRNIPLWLICATIPGKNGKIPTILNFYYKRVFNLFNNIFTTSEEHTKYFKALPVLHVETGFDTRYDRILQKVDQARTEPIINKGYYPDGTVVIVLGSSWEPDESLAIEAWNNLDNKLQQKIKFIFVPHEPTISHILSLQSKLDSAFTLSQYLASEASIQKLILKESHLIVDSIGHLLKLYAIADGAYIGGAFGAGIHSVAEPAGYGIPLACGKDYYNSTDAIHFERISALRAISNDNEFKQWMIDVLENDPETIDNAKLAAVVIKNGKGYAKYIAHLFLQEISKNLV